jgi:hypothetical protein
MFVFESQVSTPAGRAGRIWGIQGRIGGRLAETRPSWGRGHERHRGDELGAGKCINDGKGKKHRAGIEQQPSVRSRRSRCAQRSPSRSGATSCYP